MSITELRHQIDDLSGVKRTRLLDDNILQVVWEGRPNDYSKELRRLREEYPNIEQTTPPAGKDRTSPDGMPIHYYTE